MKPLLKWAGGKRWLIPKIKELIDENGENKIVFNKKNNSYFEPFFGAGAIFFSIKPFKAIISDSNSELINLYKEVKKNPNKVIIELEKMAKELEANKKYYYEIRDMERKESWKIKPNYLKAARTIFLNKSCFNGLYRVNSKGLFNVPIGRNNISNIVDLSNIKKISTFLNKNDIKIKKNDFEFIKNVAKKGDLIYFDPPYDPINQTSNFTQYTSNGFNQEDQIRLKNVADFLVKYKKANVILSNSSTTFIKELYSNQNSKAKSDVEYFILEIVYSNRNINSKIKSRKKIKEYLIYNKKIGENE